MGACAMPGSCGIGRGADGDAVLKCLLPVGAAGLEPATSCSQGRRADQTALRPATRTYAMLRLPQRSIGPGGRGRSSLCERAPPRPTARRQGRGWTASKARTSSGFRQRSLSRPAAGGPIPPDSRLSQQRPSCPREPVAMRPAIDLRAIVAWLRHPRSVSRGRIAAACEQYVGWYRSAWPGQTAPAAHGMGTTGAA